jgi:hypothetical protein
MVAVMSAAIMLQVRMIVALVTKVTIMNSAHRVTSEQSMSLDLVSLVTQDEGVVRKRNK